jgi:hypothetical protein
MIIIWLVLIVISLVWAYYALLLGLAWLVGRMHGRDGVTLSEEEIEPLRDGGWSARLSHGVYERARQAAIREKSKSKE